MKVDHELKTQSGFFWAHVHKEKSFELRSCKDREFGVDQILRLNEVVCILGEEEPRYTGSSVLVKVKFILSDYPGLEPGYCILSTELIAKSLQINEL